MLRKIELKVFALYMYVYLHFMMHISIRSNNPNPTKGNVHSRFQELLKAATLGIRNYF